MVKLATKEEEKQGHQAKPLKRIEKPRARKLTYASRKKCILKKTMELSVLCGIKACTVCIGPNGEVQTWPENQTEVRNIINSLNNKKKPGPSFGLSKTSDQSVCCLGEKAGERESFAMKKEVFERFLLGFDSGWINGLSAESLKILLADLEGKLEELTARIGFLEKVNEGKNILGSEGLLTCWFGVDTPMETSEMVSSGSGFCCQPSQNLGLDILSNTYHPLQTMVDLNDPLSSVTPMWPLDYYTDNMICFDSGMWPLAAMGGSCGGNNGDNGRFLWSYGESVEKMITDWDSMTNYSSQFLAIPSSLDELGMGYVDDSFMI